MKCSKTKQVLEVLNVGQGDSIILRPNNCTYDEETFMIDLGPGNYDITQNINEDEKVHIFLTHHHSDHINGLHFFFNKTNQISEIIMPLYQNEIVLIAKAILNLKGINASKDCGEFIGALNEMVNNQIFLKKVCENCLTFSFAYEDRPFCKHISCFNPPKIIYLPYQLSDIDKESIIPLMQEFFEVNFANNISRYIISEGMGGNTSNFPEINSIFIRNERDKINDDKDLDYSKRNFVLNFFLENSNLLRQFNEHSTRTNLQKIYMNYFKTVHDVCIVLKVKYNGKSFLLTGDASKKVFNRLINDGKDISSDYLKIPHHGSKNNMNKRILDAINPEVAIISHKNGHFGKSSDPHPNEEIIELLQDNGIKILISNDIIKDGDVRMKKSTQKSDPYVMIY